MDSPLAPTGTKCRALWMAGKGIVDMPEDVALKNLLWDKGFIG